MISLNNCIGCYKICSDIDRFSIFERDSLIQKCLVYKVFQITGIDLMFEDSKQSFLCTNCRTLIVQIHILEQQFLQNFSYERFHINNGKGVQEKDLLETKTTKTKYAPLKIFDDDNNTIDDFMNEDMQLVKEDKSCRFDNEYTTDNDEGAEIREDTFNTDIKNTSESMNDSEEAIRESEKCKRTRRTYGWVPVQLPNEITPEDYLEELGTWSKYSAKKNAKKDTNNFILANWAEERICASRNS